MKPAFVVRADRQEGQLFPNREETSHIIAGAKIWRGLFGLLLAHRIRSVAIACDGSVGRNIRANERLLLELGYELLDHLRQHRSTSVSTPQVCRSLTEARGASLVVKLVVARVCSFAEVEDAPRQ